MEHPKISSLEKIKRACALVWAQKSTGESLTGTAYLITPQYAVTCFHVVKESSQVILYIGPEEEKRYATVIESNPAADCALLKLKTPVTDVEPLKLAKSCYRGAPWEAFGFAEVTKGMGAWLTGYVQDPEAKKSDQQPAISLYAHEIAAGQGSNAQGFSGTPALVNGCVVGHITASVYYPEESRPRAEMGLLYACPSQFIEDLLPAELRPEWPIPPALFAAFSTDWYCSRAEEERRARSYLSGPGAPVVLSGPARSGKTYLLQYLLYKVSEYTQQLCRIVPLHFGLVSKSDKESLDKLLKELAQGIFEALQMDTGPVETVWKTSDSPQAKITHLMETQLLPTTDELLVLAIDEADSLWVLPPNERTEFFSMLRSWLERAGTHAVWQKLRLLMAISTDPTRLINQNNLSPFNLRPPIKLQEMKPAQIHQLLQMHGLHWPEPTINELRPLLGGNIYLWRLVMYETALNEGVIPDIRPGSLLFEPELAYFQRWLRKNPACLQELAHFQDDSIKGGNDLEACNQLVAMGLLLQEKTAHYRLRCGLYRQLVN